MLSGKANTTKMLRYLIYSMLSPFLPSDSLLIKYKDLPGGCQYQMTCNPYECNPTFENVPFHQNNVDMSPFQMYIVYLELL